MRQKAHTNTTASKALPGASMREQQTHRCSNTLQSCHVRCIASVEGPEHAPSALWLSVIQPRCFLPWPAKPRIFAYFPFDKDGWKQDDTGEWSNQSPPCNVDVTRLRNMQVEAPVRVKATYFKSHRCTTLLGVSLEDLMHALEISHDSPLREFKVPERKLNLILKLSNRESLKKAKLEASITRSNNTLKEIFENCLGKERTTAEGVEDDDKDPKAISSSRESKTTTTSKTKWTADDDSKVD